MKAVLTDTQFRSERLYLLRIELAAMNDATVKACLRKTDSLYKTVSTLVGLAGHDGTPRSHVTASLCAITLEHGYSIRALLDIGHVTSAIALLRTQFEANVRALWVYFAASDEWVDKVSSLIESGSLKEPSTPGMDDMLAAIDGVAPASIGRMLKSLKDGAWKPLNSYVHGGIHPVTQQHHGYSAGYLLQTLRNANGLATMAAMLLGVMSGDQKITGAIRRAQLDHLECLPPLAESPTET